MCVIPCATIYFICACFMTWHIPHRWLHFNLLFGRWRKRCIDHSALVSLALIWACVSLVSESTVVGVLTVSVYVNHAACYLALLDECCIPRVPSNGKLRMRFASIDDWCFHHPYPTLCGILDVERHPLCFVLVVFLGCRMIVCLCWIQRTGHRTHRFVFRFSFCHRWVWTSLCLVLFCFPPRWDGTTSPPWDLLVSIGVASSSPSPPWRVSSLVSWGCRWVSTWQVDEISSLLLPPPGPFPILGGIRAPSLPLPPISSGGGRRGDPISPSSDVSGPSFPCHVEAVDVVERCDRRRVVHSKHT